MKPSYNQLIAGDGEKEVDAGEISEGGEKEMEWKHVRFKKSIFIYG